MRRVNVCYTAKADLAECRVPSGEKGVEVTPRFHNKTNKKERRSDRSNRKNVVMMRMVNGLHLYSAFLP